MSYSLDYFFKYGEGRKVNSVVLGALCPVPWADWFFFFATKLNGCIFPHDLTSAPGLLAQIRTGASLELKKQRDVCQHFSFLHPHTVKDQWPPAGTQTQALLPSLHLTPDTQCPALRFGPSTATLRGRSHPGWTHSHPCLVSITKKMSKAEDDLSAVRQRHR